MISIDEELKNGDYELARQKLRDYYQTQEEKSWEQKKILEVKKKFSLERYYSLESLPEPMTFNASKNVFGLLFIGTIIFMILIFWNTMEGWLYYTVISIGVFIGLVVVTFSLYLFFWGTKLVLNPEGIIVRSFEGDKIYIWQDILLMMIYSQKGDSNYLLIHAKKHSKRIEIELTYFNIDIDKFGHVLALYQEKYSSIE